MAIDLAPGHKRGLILQNPILPAAGIMGFADEYAGLVDFSRLGAFVTHPVTGRARTPAHGPRVIEFPGGVLVHTGLPNPGVGDLLRECARKWERCPCPVVVHVAATTPSDVVYCVERLENAEGVAGVELGLRDDIDAEDAEDLVAAAAHAGTLPVLVRLPFGQAESLWGAALRGGAQAVVVAAPPRGALRAPTGEWVTGRVYGPGVFPLALRSVRAVAGKARLPVIGAGGVHSAEEAQAMLAAGAVAVEVDSAVWREPGILAAIALRCPA